MAIFKYSALSSNGSRKAGWINADNLEDAKADLISRHIFVTKIRRLEEKDQPHLSRSALLRFTSELSRLLKAGIPLYESLLALEEKYREEKSHLIILHLCDSLRTGMSLSDAMRQYPQSFDHLYCSMISNAEKSGTLVEALDEMELLMSKQERLKKQITNSLVYPGILTGFCFVVITALLYYVIPALFELFEGRKLHPFTEIVISISRFAIEYKSFIGMTVVSLLGLTIYSFFSKNLRNYFLGKFMRVWGVRNLMFKIALIRFSRTCGTMLQEGIPLLQALEMSRFATFHPLLSSLLEKVENNVAEGKLMTAAFKQSSQVPPLFTRMLSIAEESGKTSSMMLQLAGIYEEEIEKQLQRVTTIAQPVILLVLGLIVGLVLLSVLLPLTDVSSFIST